VWRSHYDPGRQFALAPHAGEMPERSAECYRYRYPIPRRHLWIRLNIATILFEVRDEFLELFPRRPDTDRGNLRRSNLARREASRSELGEEPSRGLPA